MEGEAPHGVAPLDMDEGKAFAHVEPTIGSLVQAGGCRFGHGTSTVHTIRLVMDEFLGRGSRCYGRNVGCLLRGVDRSGVERGQVLAKPGSITPHTDFESEVYILTKEEGGRHTPFFKGYKPQFYVRTTDVTGSVELPANVEMVMPGDNLKFNVQLGQPVALEVGTRFAIREGGRTVGSGVVTKIVK